MAYYGQEVRLGLVVMMLLGSCWGRDGGMSPERARRLYDRGCLFSPEGRIYQVEYARRAVEGGGPALGALGDDCAVVGALRSRRLREDSALLPRKDTGWRERVHRIDEHILCVSCGLVPDARQLLRALQRLASEYRLAWGTRIPVQVIASRLSEFVQTATQRTGNRPFGAAFLLAGYDDDTEKFRLFLTDPAGYFDEFRHYAITGDLPSSAKSALETAAAESPADLTMIQNGLKNALLAAVSSQSISPTADENTPKDQGPDLSTYFEFACLTLNKDGTIQSHILSTAEIAHLLRDDKNI